MKRIVKKTDLSRGGIILLFLFILSAVYFHITEIEKSSSANYSKIDPAVYLDSSKIGTLKYQEEIIDKYILMDSVLQSIYYSDGKYFIHVKLDGDQEVEILAKLVCRRETIDRIKESGEQNFLLSANLSRIDNTSSIICFEYFEENNHFALTSNILLEGYCYDIIN